MSICRQQTCIVSRGNQKAPCFITTYCKLTCLLRISNTPDLSQIDFFTNFYFPIHGRFSQRQKVKVFLVHIYLRTIGLKETFAVISDHTCPINEVDLQSTGELRGRSISHLRCVQNKNSSRDLNPPIKPACLWLLLLVVEHYSMMFKRIFKHNHPTNVGP